MFEEMTRTEAISTYVQMCEEFEPTANEYHKQQDELETAWKQLIEKFGYDGVDAELEHY